MYVGTPFIANSYSPELKEPCESAFHYPSPPAQSGTVRRVAHRQQRHDVARSQTLPDRLCIITPVAQHTVRTMTWPSSLSLQERDGIDEC